MASDSLAGPARHRALKELIKQSDSRVIRVAVGIKRWLAKTPCVDEVRPAQCAGCGCASRPVGQGLVVHGHGLLVRQVRGVLSLDEAPGVLSVPVRRYACQLCRTVMTVVPAGMLSRRQYSGPSIAWALYLWLVAGLSDRLVRLKVCAWQVRGRSARGWAQLYRWTRHVATLFSLPRKIEVLDADPHAVARRVLSMLQTQAPVTLHDAPSAQQLFEGAATTR
jgi:transposase